MMLRGHIQKSNYILYMAQVLNLRKCDSLVDFMFFPETASLHTLILAECKSVSGLYAELLLFLPALKRLDVSYCRSVGNFSSKAMLPGSEFRAWLAGLETLETAGCPAFETL